MEKIKDRYCPDPSMWGVNLEEMIKWQKDARDALHFCQGFPKEIEKLIKSYPRKISKGAAVQVVEEIVSLIPFDYTNHNPLELFCQRYSFFGPFGINHIFYVCIAPLLVTDRFWQEKYYIKINGPNDRQSLSILLGQTEKIVKTREGIKEFARIKHISEKRVFAQELRDYLNGKVVIKPSYPLPTVLHYCREGVGSREFVNKALDWNAVTTCENINF